MTSTRAPERARARERLARDRRRLRRRSKCASARAASSSAGARAGCSTAWRRACCRARESARASRRRRLSPRIETQSDVVARREPREQPVDGLRACARRPRLVRPRRSSRPGQRDLDARASTGRPRNASAASRAPPVDDAAAPGGTRSLESRCPSTTTTLAACATASFSARDLLARVAEHLGVLERDVRQQDDRRVDDVRRVEPAAEPGLDDRHVDAALGELGERGRGQRLELGRAERLRGAANARDGPLEARRDHNPAARASRRRAATCRRPTRRPSAAEQRRDRPRRGRLAVRADDVDRRDRRAAGRRAPRAARACARARTPPATGSSDATQSVAVDGLVAEGIELTAVALELLALRLDDLGGRLRGEPLVGEHPLGARDLLARAARSRPRRCRRS